MSNQQQRLRPPQVVAGFFPDLNDGEERDLEPHHPEFFPRLERCAIANQKLVEISQNQRPAVIQFCQRLPWAAVMIWQVLRLYLLPDINTENCDRKSIKEP